MKQNMMKKMSALLCAGTMVLGLAACGEKPATPNAGSEPNTAEKTYQIAIVKQLDHASLDEIADAVCARLDAIAAEEGVAISYEVYSGQNDQSVLMQIGSQVVADKVDAIIPVATLAAQVMTVAAEESKIPVIFAAVSDPETAALTGIEYVSGVSDALNTEYIMDMMLHQNAELEKVGLLYSLSEANSTKPIAEAKVYLDNSSIAYSEATANTRDEVIAAVASLKADGVQTIFTPTDNVIMAAELAIYEELIEAGIPHYTGADSFVRNGAFVTCGVNYTDLGARVADLAIEAITGGMETMEDYYLMEGGIVTVNTETAAALGVDYSVFAGFGELVEVTTSID